MNQVFGFAAQDLETVYFDHDEIHTGLSEAVEKHLSWTSIYRSPFISTFADKRHAENWALDWSRRHSDLVCDVFEIDPAKLSYIFHAEELSKNLLLHVPQKAYQNLSDEYLILNHIPEKAIVGHQSTKVIKESK